MGDLSTNYKDVKTTAVNFYETLFSEPNQNSSNRMQLLDGVELKQKSDDQINALQTEVTVNEIQQAIFAMGDNKAPGPDGYTTDFYKMSCLSNNYMSLH